MQLSREAITEAALGILNEYGLADVSMRRIAGALGVAPGALYWHIENKQELIASLAATIVAPLLDNPPSDPAQLSASLRTQVLGVRDGAEVVVAAISQPDAPVRTGLEHAFVEAVEGFTEASQSKKLAAARGLIHLTLGAASVQQSSTQLAAATGELFLNDDAELASQHAASVQFLLDGLGCSGVD